MTNSEIRTIKEMQNLFADKKNQRKAWQAIGKAILQNPAKITAQQFDKDGTLSLQSELEQYTYQKLAKDIKELGKENREPTEIEMIMYGQIVKARWDTAAATFVRDTLGAKPVDETKMDATINNPYEELTDEELELLAKARAERAVHVADVTDTHDAPARDSRTGDHYIDTPVRTLSQEPSCNETTLDEVITPTALHLEEA